MTNRSTRVIDLGRAHLGSTAGGAGRATTGFERRVPGRGDPSKGDRSDGDPEKAHPDRGMFGATRGWELGGYGLTRLASARWASSRRRLTGALALGFVFLATSAARAAPDRFDVVVLDAGHGGHDEGATGPSGLREKDLVLDVARRLAERLRERGRARGADPERRPLPVARGAHLGRQRRARRSLRLDPRQRLSEPPPRGIETYFASLDATDDDAASRRGARERGLRGEAPERFERDDPLAAILGDLIETQHLQESSEFAKLAQHELVEIGRARSRGVKQAPFVVLLGVQMPASLVEIGFLTNPDEEKGLRRARAPRGDRGCARRVRSAPSPTVTTRAAACRLRSTAMRLAGKDGESRAPIGIAEGWTDGRTSCVPSTSRWTSRSSRSARCCARWAGRACCAPSARSPACRAGCRAAVGAG